MTDTHRDCPCAYKTMHQNDHALSMSYAFDSTNRPHNHTVRRRATQSCLRNSNKCCLRCCLGRPVTCFQRSTSAACWPLAQRLLRLPGWPVDGQLVRIAS